ncbi:MAG: TonB family protein [Bacteroidota bacterium]
MKSLIFLLLFVSTAILSAQNGTLLIKAKSDCTIRVDGEESIALKNGDIRKFTLLPGTHLVEAKAGKQLKEEIVEISENRQSLLILQFEEGSETSPQQDVPKVSTLDPNHLYSFGNGSEGLRGRGVLKLVDPIYNEQLEGILEFKFRIEPNGSVSYATTTGPTSKTALKAAGIAAIKKWRFTAISSGQPQWVTVKITFRIKK